MKKNYIPKEAEEAIYAHWENSNFFKAIPDKSKEPFCIMIPPPNVLEPCTWDTDFRTLSWMP